MPTDPAELLALAAARNGLQNAGSEPLHLKATYEILDDKGEVKEKGTFEEFKMSSRKYKVIYTSPSFNQTDYATEIAWFRTGDQKSPDGMAITARNLMYPTFPPAEVVAKSKLKLADRPVGAAHLKCVGLENLKVPSPFYGAVYCFSSTAPILRLSETMYGATETIYNGIVSAKGAYVARDSTFSQLGKEVLRVHLDSLETLPRMEESTIAPPQGAVELAKRADADAEKTPKKPQRVQPEYPPIARAAGVQGTVTIQAIIGTDGKVKDLRTISGPPMLVAPAEQAVRQWEYEPHLVDGQPVEVGTEVNVVFRLGVMPPN